MTKFKIILSYPYLITDIVASRPAQGSTLITAQQAAFYLNFHLSHAGRKSQRKNNIFHILDIIAG